MGNSGGPVEGGGNGRDREAKRVRVGGEIVPRRSSFKSSINSEYYQR